MPKSPPRNSSPSLAVTSVTVSSMAKLLSTRGSPSIVEHHAIFAVADRQHPGRSLSSGFSPSDKKARRWKYPRRLRPPASRVMKLLTAAIECKNQISWLHRLNHALPARSRSYVTASMCAVQNYSLVRSYWPSSKRNEQFAARCLFGFIRPRCVPRV